MTCGVEEAKISSKYLLLSVDECLYAVKIPFVQKIVQTPSISPLPLTPAHVLGVAKANGEVYTVMDLRILFGERFGTASLPSTAVLLTYRGAQICAVADRILSVADFSKETAVCPTAGASWITGVIHSDAMSINLLSMDYLFCGSKKEASRFP